MPRLRRLNKDLTHARQQLGISRLGHLSRPSPDVCDPIARLSRASRKRAPEARHRLAQPVRAGLKAERMTSTVGAAPSLVRLKVLHPPSAVDLPHAPSDCACVLHRRPYLRARVNRHSRNALLLHRQAWFPMSGDVDVCAVAQQDPPVNAMEWAIVARDQQVIHFRCAEPPTANPDKYADELLRVSGFVLTNREQTSLPVR